MKWVDLTKLTIYSGHCVCSYHLIIEEDPKLVKKDTAPKIVDVLRMLRVALTALLPNERFCWLVYNVSIHTYTVARNLMQLGFSKQVSSFLLILIDFDTKFKTSNQFLFLFEGSRVYTFLFAGFWKLNTSIECQIFVVANHIVFGRLPMLLRLQIWRRSRSKMVFVIWLFVE